MPDLKELAGVAESLTSELKKLAEHGAAADEVQSMKDQASDLASDLEDAWEEAYEKEVNETYEEEEALAKELSGEGA